MKSAEKLEAASSAADCLGTAITYRRSMIPIAITSGVLAIALSGFLIWRQWFETYHFAVVQQGILYRDGNRGLREFATMLRRAQPRTIVSLIDDQEFVDASKPEFAAEIEFAKLQAIPVERVAVKLGGWPTTGDVRRFLELATDKRKQPVVFHCAQGVRRTGMMAAAYQLSVMELPKEKVKELILTFGHSERSIGDVKRFIDVYDPIRREVTEQLPQSQEK